MALKSISFKKWLFILLVLAWPAALMAVTPPLPAHPAQYVVDLAGVLDADTRTRLNDRLKDLEAETTAQMVVLTSNPWTGSP